MIPVCKKRQSLKHHIYSVFVMYNCGSSDVGMIVSIIYLNKTFRWLYKNNAEY